MSNRLELIKKENNQDNRSKFKINLKIIQACLGNFYYVSVMSMTHRMINPRNRENSSGRIIMHREIQKQKTGNDSSSKVLFIYIYPIYVYVRIPQLKIFFNTTSNQVIGLYIINLDYDLEMFNMDYQI